MPRGKTVKDVPADKFVMALAAHFKKNDKFQVPVWADVVKTGAHKELAPINPDWYFVRAAAIARRVYVNGGSVGRFCRVFGGKKRNGSQKSHFHKCAKGISRNILKQLEEVNLVAQSEEGGRRITSAGQRELDTVAAQIEVKTPIFLVQ